MSSQSWRNVSRSQYLTRTDLCRQIVICLHIEKSLYDRNRTLLLLFKADDARSNKLVEAMIKQNEQTCLQDLQEFRLGRFSKKLHLNQSEWLNRYKSCKNLNQSVPSICLFWTNQNGQIGPNPAKWDERDRSPTTRPSKRHMVLTASSRAILACVHPFPGPRRRPR